MKLCPTCAKPIDPLRAGQVAVIDGVFHYFCDRTCQSKFEGRFEAAPDPSLARSEPSLPQTERRRTARHEGTLRLSSAGNHVEKRTTLAAIAMRPADITSPQTRRSSHLESSLSAVARTSNLAVSEGLPSELREELDQERISVGAHEPFPPTPSAFPPSSLTSDRLPNDALSRGHGRGDGQIDDRATKSETVPMTIADSDSMHSAYSGEERRTASGPVDSDRSQPVFARRRGDRRSARARLFARAASKDSALATAPIEQADDSAGDASERANESAAASPKVSSNPEPSQPPARVHAKTMIGAQVSTNEKVNVKTSSARRASLRPQTKTLAIPKAGLDSADTASVRLGNSNKRRVNVEAEVPDDDFRAPIELAETPLLPVSPFARREYEPSQQRAGLLAPIAGVAAALAIALGLLGDRTNSVRAGLLFVAELLLCIWLFLNPPQSSTQATGRVRPWLRRLQLVGGTLLGACSTAWFFRTEWLPDFISVTAVAILATVGYEWLVQSVLAHCTEEQQIEVEGVSELSAKAGTIELVSLGVQLAFMIVAVLSIFGATNAPRLVRGLMAVTAVVGAFPMRAVRALLDVAFGTIVAEAQRVRITVLDVAGIDAAAAVNRFLLFDVVPWLCDELRFDRLVMLSATSTLADEAEAKTIARELAEFLPNTGWMQVVRALSVADDQVALRHVFRSPVTRADVATGVSATMLRGAAFSLGNRQYFAENLISVARADELVHNDLEGGKLAVYLAKERRIVAVLLLEFHVTDDARSAAAELASVGVDTVLLSPDSREVGECIANDVGLSHVYPETSPAGYDELVRQMLAMDVVLAAPRHASMESANGIFVHCALDWPSAVSDTSQVNLEEARSQRDPVGKHPAGRDARRLSLSLMKSSGDPAALADVKTQPAVAMHVMLPSPQLGPAAHFVAVSHREVRRVRSTTFFTLLALSPVLLFATLGVVPLWIVPLAGLLAAAVNMVPKMRPKTT
jgi:YHS domain-containing protein